MLSLRGAASAKTQDIPWRFAPGGNNRYDAVTNPGGVISFATAENACLPTPLFFLVLSPMLHTRVSNTGLQNLMHDELHDFVQKNVSIPKLAYAYRFSTMGGPRFPAAMAAHINEHFHPAAPVQAEDIITASGLTAIHELVGYSLADPGDGILVNRPVYGRFELDFGNTSGLRMVYADMDGIDPCSPAAVAKYQERLDASTAEGIPIKAVLIVNPNNPLGRAYPADTLRALMAFCETNKIHLISDEVYGLSTYSLDDGHDVPFTSVLSFDSTNLLDKDRLHVLYGMSKVNRRVL
ncbi:aspartate aminotransferase [Sporothrix schenckii 1099-18]|uniref:Aspartate aminotransferase n=1 Tax=Sporothrix schenckii 1099-18 TaxID=1397361 RepID=A0A0F2M7N4_SPOSC|nr:aspartate aminotransferase [Sporothrix schenckii 1099-18]KJR85084.1 aspartate aminotransferase [Sporothrix schenckii 1099-18]